MKKVGLRTIGNLLGIAMMDYAEALYIARQIPGDMLNFIHLIQFQHHGKSVQDLVAELARRIPTDKLSYDVLQDATCAQSEETKWLAEELLMKHFKEMLTNDELRAMNVSSCAIVRHNARVILIERGQCGDRKAHADEFIKTYILD